MRGRHGLGRDVTGMPVVLMAGMQDAAEIGLDGGPDQGRAIHYRGNSFQPFTDLQTIDGCRDRGKGAQHVSDFEPLLERQIAFRIEGVACGCLTEPGSLAFSKRGVPAIKAAAPAALNCLRKSRRTICAGVSGSISNVISCSHRV